MIVYNELNKLPGRPNNERGSGWAQCFYDVDSARTIVKVTNVDELISMKPSPDSASKDFCFFSHIALEIDFAK